ncbi:sugar ABC transporter permease [Paenibacillus apis]|uniref:Sugar ABC transporter permease n=2 Tax=Paenibacillus TaxID=44249 RepID=A0A919Y4M5_9BACL|nr:sugar ABC transporter permease [Paenibacillus apis]
MQASMLKWAVNLLKTFMFPIAVYLSILIITLLMSKTGYVSFGAFDRIVRGSVLTTITAYAIALPLSGGRWDFAPGIIIMLAGIIGSNLTIDLGLGPVMLLAITMAVAILLSLFEGLLYVWIRVPTIIVSLGVVMMYEAISGVVYGGSGTQLFMHANLTIFARSPWIYILLAVVMVSFYYLLGHTKFGYDTRSLSANPRLAVNMGVKEKKNILLTYLVVGGLLGISAVINASTVLVSPAGNLSSTALMFSSMAPVLMGLHLAQFTNLPLGIFAGALGMNALSYGMVVMGINSSLQTVVIGVFIVVFMAYTTNQERIRTYLNRTKAGRKASA